MAKRNDFTEWAEEQLAPLGIIRLKSMFGAFGLYADELFFALIDDDVLYFKADHLNRHRFVEAGCEVFRYPMKDGSVNELSYYQAPESALDDQTELLEWARLGLEAAVRARAAKLPKKAPRWA
ncbi:MAG TPA: TfoX/Sxy family protein [Magnetospirillaceae bacterium]|nr:TfoX/Sxy family protein [Magnetospirillaceae bacterium]